MLAKVSPSKSACQCAWTATMEMIHAHKINKNTRFASLSLSLSAARGGTNSWSLPHTPESQWTVVPGCNAPPTLYQKKTITCYILLEFDWRNRNFSQFVQPPDSKSSIFLHLYQRLFSRGGNPKIHCRHRRKYTSMTYKSNSWGFWLVWRFSGGGSISTFIAPKLQQQQQQPRN